MAAARGGVKPIKIGCHNHEEFLTSGILDLTNSWGMTAHGLFILHCSNYLFLERL
jgi:hypothetical protein